MNLVYFSIYLESFKFLASLSFCCIDFAAWLSVSLSISCRNTTDIFSFSFF